FGTTPFAYAAFSNETDKVLGVGRIQSNTANPVATQDKFALGSLDGTTASVAVEQIAAPLGREVVIEEPVVEPAPFVVPGEWMTGLASAYALGNDGVDNTTADGSYMDDNSFGVAVPVGWAYLLGSTIEIKYGDMVVTGYINDTGGFGGYGRALDLQPGIWKAFGCNTEYEWGVRTIQWRIV
ncbi:MAG: RlpA-like double-psi beta-barrel domain-containing protein, partial [Coriobacteriales bacterium]|nr:RlpA-like double-psi beta-barrel domain-containing protein [Coriobacteriales bacterium]